MYKICVKIEFMIKENEITFSAIIISTPQSLLLIYFVFIAVTFTSTRFKSVALKMICYILETYK